MTLNGIHPKEREAILKTYWLEILARGVENSIRKGKAVPAFIAKIAQQ